MKRIYFVFAALLLSLFTAADSYGAIKLRIMSFNIRCLNGGDAPENQWDQRADRVGEYINEVKPDLFGMQEVVYKQFEDVKARVKGYECIYAGRDDGKNGGEGTPIFYRPDKYRLIKSGHYWRKRPKNLPSAGKPHACALHCGPCLKTSRAANASFTATHTSTTSASKHASSRPCWPKTACAQ